MTPHFCVLRMSKVPRLPHILGFGRVWRGVPFLSVLCVTNLRRCFAEAEAFRDLPDADDALVFSQLMGKNICMQENEKHGMKTPQALGLMGRSLD